MRLDDLPTPALLLDQDRLEANLDRVAERCRRLGVRLRPHVKTHKSVEIARLQGDRGARGWTVSTLAEAAQLLDHGLDDLTWAFPLVPSRLAEAAELAARGALRVTVDSEQAAELLAASGRPWRVWLEVDCGDGRSGVDPAAAGAEALARRLAGSSTLRFEGLLTHGGHAYAGPDRAAVRAAAAQEAATTARFAARLRAAGVAVPAVSIGSTPGFSAYARLDGVDEVRPGNYVFYDATQVALGSARLADCALTVLATVVSSRPGSGRSVVDAGALALSKDPGAAWVEPATMGRIFADYNAARLDPATHVAALSQEHGHVAGDLPYGARVRILPNHACLAVACFDEYVVVRGERVVDRWPIHRRR